MDRILGYKALVQLWSMGALPPNSSPSAQTTPSLALGLAHDYGCVRAMQWCPSGVWQSVEAGEGEGEEGALPRLGLLALACSDGCLRLLRWAE